MNLLEKIAAVKVLRGRDRKSGVISRENALKVRVDAGEKRLSPRQSAVLRENAHAMKVHASNPKSNLMKVKTRARIDTDNAFGKGAHKKTLETKARNAKEYKQATTAQRRYKAVSDRKFGESVAKVKKLAPKVLAGAAAAGAVAYGAKKLADKVRSRNG